KQTAAMTMATRLVVMKDGIIQHVGAAKDVYDNPDNVSVGGFIGSPAMNMLRGPLTDVYFNLEDVKINVTEGKVKVLRDQGYINKDIILGIRPEDMHDEPLFLDSSPETKFTAIIDVAELMGAESYLYSKINDQDFVARVDSRSDIRGGENVDIALNMNNAHFFDSETELRIR